MELTIENLEILLPWAALSETDAGIRIEATAYSDLPAIGDLMRAAATLKLSPDQIHDNSSYEVGTDWGGETGRESDRIYLDVLFTFAESA